MSRLRWFTAGESHGPELVAIIEGLPAGFEVREDRIRIDLARRQQGFGRGGRMKIETDTAEIVAGVRGGETLGSPIAIRIANRDFENWKGRMGAAPFDTPPEAVTRPRPGHADLAGATKYDRSDLRDILERASARETAARVALGAICRAFLEPLGVDVFAHVISIGEAAIGAVPDDLGHIKALARASEMACCDAEAEARMRQAILDTAHDKDTLGGVFEVVATGVPVGLGSHIQWDRRLDGRLAQALMSIQAIKGVELGLGFEAARRRGSDVHDPIVKGEADTMTRSSNGAGGVEGGISNGMPIVCRAAMKPIATLRRPLPSVDIVTKDVSLAAFERSDICAVPAASVVGEAMVLLTLADAMMEKLGGDSLREVRRNLDSYVARVRELGR
ncbi:MAG: chorismate synthase [Polyangiaceae bacterium]|nr:chorismate synthase [Polyangiaceae bacterium]